MCREGVRGGPFQPKAIQWFCDPRESPALVLGVLLKHPKAPWAGDGSDTASQGGMWGGQEDPLHSSPPLRGQRCTNRCSVLLSDAGRSPSPKARLWDTEMLFMLHVPGMGRVLVAFGTAGPSAIRSCVSVQTESSFL